MANTALLSPAEALDLSTLFCVFLVRVTAGYAAAWILSKLCRSAAIRCVIWLVFLFTFTVYWLYCTGTFAWHASHAAVVGVSATSVHLVVLPADYLRLAALAMNLGAASYAIVVLGFGITGSIARWRVGAALGSRVAPPEQIATRFLALTQIMGAPSCQLWLMPGLPSPASFGWWKPAVYLPAGEPLNDDRKLQDVLWHELTHIRRRDALWDYLTRIATATLWFHPLIHRAAAAVRVEREIACDLSVVRQDPAQRHQYADTLVHFGWKASVAPDPDHLKIALAAPAAVLSRRIRVILAGEQQTSIWSKALRSLVSTAALWSLATVMPLLWISFALRTAASQPKASPLQLRQTSSNGRSPRYRRRNPLPSRAVDQDVVAQSPALSPDIQSIPGQREEPRPRYTLMPNANAPLFNTVQPDEASTSIGFPRSRGSATNLPGSASLPKGSVLVDAAEQLSRMGIGRGGDHDHD